jgi:hypothetical protein
MSRQAIIRTPGRLRYFVSAFEFGLVPNSLSAKIAMHSAPNHTSSFSPPHLFALPLRGMVILTPPRKVIYPQANSHALLQFAFWWRKRLVVGHRRTHLRANIPSASIMRAYSWFRYNRKDDPVSWDEAFLSFSLVSRQSLEFRKPSFHARSPDGPYLISKY